jgi:hypothetical protein
MSNHIYQVNYAELERFAAEHDLNAEEITQWAAQDPDFAERYLQTHGKINFGTYLKIKEFLASKLAAGAAFAERNTQTSTALRGVVASTSAVDESNAATLVSSATADPSQAGGAYVNIGPGEEPNTTLWRSTVPTFVGEPGQWSAADPVSGPSGQAGQ